MSRSKAASESATASKRPASSTSGTSSTHSTPSCATRARATNQRWLGTATALSWSCSTASSARATSPADANGAGDSAVRHPRLRGDRRWGGGMECHLPKDIDMNANLAAQGPLLADADLSCREEVIELD